MLSKYTVPKGKRKSYLLLLMNSEIDFESIYGFSLRTCNLSFN